MKENWLLALAVTSLSMGCATTSHEPESPPAPLRSEDVSHDEYVLTGEEPASAPASNKEGATCRGRATQALVETLSLQGAAAKPCYDDLLRRNPKAKGRVRIAVKLGADGRLLEGPVLVLDELQDQEMNECILEKFAAGAPATPPDGGCVYVNIPLNLQPSTAPVATSGAGELTDGHTPPRSHRE